MKKIYIVSIITMLLWNNALGQTQIPKKNTQMNLDCKKCHICDTPTKANPCLILCPRNEISIVRHTPNEGPDIIVIHQIKNDEDIYGPSTFSHRLHSEMSLMAGGCTICHHFNPPGKIVKCSTCHEANRIRDDLNKPDLKAAYHRQCMGCHKTWEKKSNCENCHQLNSKVKKQNVESTIQKVHPEIKIPKKIIYETGSEQGDIVTFFHDDHSSLFGNECSDCHTQENCSTCHSENKSQNLNFDEHDRCSSCHETEKNCITCHKSEISQPFNHKKKTGFSLNEYHNNLSCISCHKSKNNFKGLNKNCETCHKDGDGYFNHGITKLKLDDTHIEFYCENCHRMKNYKIQPTCDECHDEDIYYPDSVPGERIN